MVGTSSSGNRFSKDNGLLLFMPGEHQLALARLQANRGLGRSYAGLLALTEGFHELGCLDKEEYEALKERYSQKLPCSVVSERTRPRTVEVVMEQTRLKKLEADFSNAVTNWPLMTEKARLYWLKKAKEFNGKVPSAQMLLEIAAEDAGPAKHETSGRIGVKNGDETRRTSA